jgi:hypothetical protein
MGQESCEYAVKEELEEQELKRRSFIGGMVAAVVAAFVPWKAKAQEEIELSPSCNVAADPRSKRITPEIAREVEGQLGQAMGSFDDDMRSAVADAQIPIKADHPFKGKNGAISTGPCAVCNGPVTLHRYIRFPG